jgi:non-ribosomal peptide synthase protein (TIGR01720 family)
MLKRALEQIIAHHDVLRSSFSMKNENWVQEISEAAVQTPFYHYDLAEMSEVDRQDFIQSKAEELQSSFILDSPPLVRLAYFDSEKHTSGRLLVIFHHLVIDGVSIRIFVEDFLTVYMQLLGKSTVTLPAKTTSYLDWASRLVDYANSDAIYGEIEYWRVIEQLTSADNLYSLQLDFPDGLNTYGLVKDITLFLSTQETGALVREIPAKHALPVNAVLLTALLRSFYRQSGYRSILIETEGHGREEIPESTLSGIDLSRSIGWFTSLYPLYLELVDSHSNLEQVQSIANQIDKIPWRGMGFGLIKFLRKDPGLKDILNRIPQPEINFNYLGQFDQQGVALTDEPVSLTEAPIQVVNEDVGREQDAASPRSARLYIVAAITDGQLGIRWLYSQGIHQQSTILKMAQAYLGEVRTIIREIS